MENKTKMKKIYLFIDLNIFFEKNIQIIFDNKLISFLKFNYQPTQKNKKVSIIGCGTNKSWVFDGFLIFLIFLIFLYIF
jgi:hypothetical protein